MKPTGIPGNMAAALGKALRRLVTGLALALLVSACSKAEPCGEGVPRHARHPYTEKTCPMAGRMGAFRLAVPLQYRFADVGYKGYDIWQPKTHRFNPALPTLDDELAYFTTLVRRNNFKPIESWADKADADAFAKDELSTPPARRWMWVTFQYEGRVADPAIGALPASAMDSARHLEAHVQSAGEGLTGNGAYVLQRQRQWGLEHYATTRPPGIGMDERHRDIFFDTATRQTLLLCMTTLISVPPHSPMASCTDYFRIVHPDTHDVVLVTVNLLMQSAVDVADWRDIEHGVRALFASFLVH